MSEHPARDGQFMPRAYDLDLGHTLDMRAPLRTTDAFRSTSNHQRGRKDISARGHNLNKIFITKVTVEH